MDGAKRLAKLMINEQIASFHRSKLYLHKNSCRKCCWWASACETRPISTSIVRLQVDKRVQKRARERSRAANLWLASPDERRDAWTSLDRRCRRPSTSSCGICTGANRQLECPSGRHTWLEDSDRWLSPWKRERSAYRRKRERERVSSASHDTSCHSYRPLLVIT